MALVLGANGTLTTPLLLPKIFTAILDAAHTTGLGTLTGDAWEYEVHFEVSHDGVVVTQINSPVWPMNPGYTNGKEFEFTEADHGIPNYTFTIVLANISNSSPAGWTATLAVSVPPVYPSTLKSAGAVKLTASNKNWTFGTNGTLTFPDNTAQTTAWTGTFPAPANGDSTSGVANLVFYDGVWKNTSKIGVNPISGTLTVAGTDGRGGIILPNQATISAVDIGYRFISTSNGPGGVTVQQNSLTVGIANTTLANAISADPGSFTIDFNGGLNDVVIAGISGPQGGTNVYTITGTWPANTTGFPITITSNDYVAGGITKLNSDLGATITTTGGSWKFDTNGNLTLPYPGNLGSKIKGGPDGGINSIDLSWELTLASGKTIKINPGGSGVVSPTLFSFNSDVTGGSIGLPAGSSINDKLSGVLITGAGETRVNRFYKKLNNNLYETVDTDTGVTYRLINQAGTWSLDVVGDSNPRYTSTDLVTWTGGTSPAPTGELTTRATTLTVGTNTWRFGTDGTLTLPGNITTTVDNNVTVNTSANVTTNNSYTNTVDFSTDIDLGGGQGVLPGWYQRTASQIEFSLFGPGPFYSYLTSLALGRTVIVTYATAGGNQTLTGTITQQFIGITQADPANPTWGRVSGRIDAILPADQTGIVSINFPVYSTSSKTWTFGTDGSTILPENTLKGYCFTATNTVFNYIPTRAAFMYTDSPLLAKISTIGGLWYIKGPGLIGWKQITGVLDNGGVALLVDIGPMSDGSVFHSKGYLPNSPDLVYTISQFLDLDLKVADKTWNFSENGSLTFPDATVQTTAYLAPTTGNNVISSVEPLTISRNGMTIRVTSAGMIQMSFNSVINITGRSSINNADSVVISSPNGATTAGTWYNIGAVLGINDHLTATIVDNSFHRIYRLTVIIREKDATPGLELVVAYAIIEQLQ